MPLLVEMGAAFHAASGEAGEFCPDTVIRFLRYLMREGCLFVSERGMIGGFAWPSPWSRDHRIAMEAFWWAEDRNGSALMQAFEDWAASIGAQDIRMGYLHKLAPEKVERKLRSRGYEPLETIMVKKWPDRS